MRQTARLRRLETLVNKPERRLANAHRLPGETAAETTARLRRELQLGEPALIIIEGTTK